MKHETLITQFSFLSIRKYIKTVNQFYSLKFDVYFKVLQTNFLVVCLAILRHFVVPSCYLYTTIKYKTANTTKIYETLQKQMLFSLQKA